jgi:hypothetical protein
METTFKLSGNRTLKIVIDQDSENPRSWDNLAKVIIFGNKRGLGDKHEMISNYYSNWDENKKGVLKNYDVAVIRPLFLYSHSGETISTSPFDCKFDSGQIGWVIVTKEDVRANFSIKNVTAKYRVDALQILEAEINTLDQYVSGEVYGFEMLDENDIIDDSCYGFYGSDIKTNGILDHISDEDKEEVLTQIK